MRTTTITFREERRSVKATVECKSCGEKVQRTFTGTATHNPFNKGEPAKQAQEKAERAAQDARENGITCAWCDEAPIREALLALADGTPLPPRKWNNPTDFLLDRKHVIEIIDWSPCPTCGTEKSALIGHKITDKGERAIERYRKGIAKREADIRRDAAE